MDKLPFLWFASLSLVAHFSIATAFTTDLPLLGQCEISWCSHASKYRLPMQATWHANGTFSWVSRFKTKIGDERGLGIISNTPVRTTFPDGSWEISQKIANNVGMHDSNSCCCEYISGGANPLFPVTLTDYCFLSSNASSWERSCEQFKDASCPANNATALTVWTSAPYHELYVNCEAPSALELGTSYTLEDEKGMSMVIMM